MPVNQDDAVQRKIKSLQKVHEDFLARMAEFEKEQSELAKKFRAVVDKKKIHNVLEKIIKMKE